MNPLHKVISIVAALFIAATPNAQTVKQIEVSGTAPYTDHVSLLKGGADMDMMIKFMFNEAENTLTVSLISYRELFTFQNDTRYRQAVRGFKLHPEKLPYVVEPEKDTTFKLAKTLRKDIRHKRKYIFKRWIEYESLQPRPCKYRMVNDYIEQQFDITNKATDVTVSIRDILVMERKESRKKTTYNLFFITDMDREYEIKIRRDPCFGKEDDIKASAASVESIKSAYTALNGKFGASSTARTPESRQLFEEMKAILEKQFPRKDESSACLEIRSNTEKYNSYVDSIGQMQCKYTIETEKADTLSMSADYILAMARKIDNNVNRWLLTTDKIEKKDLAASSKQIIEKISTAVKAATVITETQKAAIKIFNEAENYFYKTCVKG